MSDVSRSETKIYALLYVCVVKTCRYIRTVFLRGKHHQSHVATLHK